MDRGTFVECLNKSEIPGPIFKELFIEMVTDRGKTLEVAETMYSHLSLFSLFNIDAQVIEYHKKKNNIITLLSKDGRVIKHY